MRSQADELEREMLQRIQEVHRSYKREIVLWEPPGEMLRSRDVKSPVRIKVERPNNNAT
jgi:hypothetical protein